MMLEWLTSRLAMESMSHVASLLAVVQKKAQRNVKYKKLEPTRSRSRVVCQLTGEWIFPGRGY
jgi:hypothetical protein